jgi:hypothetical protein
LHGVDASADPYLPPFYRERSLRPGNLWSVDRRSAFKRVAELCGDRFTLLEKIGRAVATAPDLAVKASGA